MDAKEKQLKLDSLITETEYDATNVEGRVYKDNSDDFMRFHDVATDKKFLGFVAVAIPNPALTDEEQLESLVDIYGDSVIVKSCLNAVAIKRQQDCRKSVKTKTMPETEFNRRFDALDTDTLHRLKTMEYIRKHIEAKWIEDQQNVTDGELRLF